MNDDSDDQGACRVSAVCVSGCRLPVDSGLRDQGWEWRCNADGIKLRQAVDSYKELGFAVRLGRLDLSALSEGCAGCKPALSEASAVFVKHKTA